MVRRFSQDRLAPGAAAREKAGAIEPEIIRELGELGIFGATTPAQWDGSEIDPVTYALLLEEIAAGDGSVSTMVSVHNSPTCIVFDQYGTDAQKDRWLRPLATGDGSRLVRADRAAGRLRRIQPAHARGEEGRPLRDQRRQAVHLLGQHPGQHGAVRGHRSVRPAARASRASSSTRRRRATSSPAGRKSSARRRPRPARWRSRTWRCRRTSASAPRARATGSRCPRWRAGRIGIAAQSVGMARAALDYAVAYAKDRQAFGGRIIDLQAVGFRLVDAKTKAGGGAPDDAARRAPEGGGQAGAGGRVHGQAVRRPRRPRRSAPRRSRRWAAMAIWPTIRWSGSIATCGCARSTKARRTCRS